jgi:hypothetical protein
LVISSDPGVPVDSVRNDVEGMSTAIEVATRVSGRTTLLALKPFAVLVTTVGAALPPLPADGSIAHKTARDKSPPIAPVVNNRPRPIVIGGSVCTHSA